MLSVDEDVLCLYVSVNYPFAVKILDSLYYQFEELLRLFLFQSVLRFGEQVSIERVGTPVLLDDDYLLRSFYSLYYFGYCRVAYLSLNRYLSLHIVYFVGLVEVELLIDFEGHLDVINLIIGHSHDSISTFTQLTINLIFV